MITRRTMFGIIAAPALVKVTSIMPVKAMPADFGVLIADINPQPTPVYRYFRWYVRSSSVGAPHLVEVTGESTYDFRALVEDDRLTLTP